MKIAIAPLLFLISAMIGCSSTFERHRLVVFGSDEQPVGMAEFLDLADAINEELGLKMYDLSGSPFPERIKVLTTVRTDDAEMPSWLKVAYIKATRSVVVIYSSQYRDRRTEIDIVMEQVLRTAESHSAAIRVSEWESDQTKSSWSGDVPIVVKTGGGSCWVGLVVG